MKLLFLSLLAFVITPNYSNGGGGGRILFLAPMGSKSHKIFFMGIIETLAKRGHHVTYVTPHEPFKKLDNVREVVLENATGEALLANIFENPAAGSPMFANAAKFCVDGLEQKCVQDLKNEQFDVIILSIFFDFCFLSLVHHFKVPFIYASPTTFKGPFTGLINNPDFPAVTGNILWNYEFPLTYTQRLTTTGINSAIWFSASYYLVPGIMNLCKERDLCPPDMPTFEEFSNNASLAIFNGVRALENPPRPTMPNVVYAGGAHIKPSKPLSKELEDWIQGSGEDGFIFFSLGSAINPSYLPERYREILVKVFGSLKQRVLWKWSEESMPNLPENVRLGKWLPQTDILGHPKLRLFITHGGLLSTLESTYNGVPIIGMPVFADQYSNMGEIEKEGWGKTMQWKSLDEKTFRNLIEEVVNCKKMREISQHRSVLMRDRLVDPADEAAYWIEYVMRHKGAPHIMSPFRLMKWYEIYNIDVWASIGAVILVIFYLIWLVLKFSFRFFFRSATSSKSKNKKD